MSGFEIPNFENVGVSDFFFFFGFGSRANEDGNVHKHDTHTKPELESVWIDYGMR